MNNVNWLVPTPMGDLLEFPYDELMAATKLAQVAGTKVIPLILDVVTNYYRAIINGVVIYDPLSEAVS